jgi:hypothetical protein
MKKYNWSDISNLPISDAAVRDLYPNKAAYRVISNNYKPNQRFGSTKSVPTKIYALAGSCKYILQNAEEIAINESEILELEPNYYFIEIIGDSPFNFVAVCTLPIIEK